MKPTKQGVIIISLLASVTLVNAQPQITKAQADAMHPLDQVPTTGLFWSLRSLVNDGQFGPPMPVDLFAGTRLNVPVYGLGQNQFILDDVDVSYADLTSESTSAWKGASPLVVEPPPPGGGGGTNPPPNPWTLERNSVKFMAHAFSVIDTNDVSGSNTNLYNALLQFPLDRTTNADLQIMQYTTNAVIIKANHFNYSTQSADFALIVCDKVQTRFNKSIDLVAHTSDALDGWLIQGLVPNWQVTDPMYMLVTNIGPDCYAFFTAIPYSGPTIVLSGPQPNTTVSNTVAIHANVTDLSGTTNQQLSVTVSGLAARSTLTSGNTINVDTRYSNAGSENVEVTVDNNNANVLNPTNAAADVQQVFINSGVLTLDFENPVYVAAASDMCSPDVGTNYIFFSVNKAQAVQAIIFNPANGQVVQNSYGNVSPGIVEIAWNFTGSDGVTPYTNNTYAVEFIASDPTTLFITNWIDRVGVRPAGGVIVNYQHDKPGWFGSGTWFNGQADTWMQTLEFMYDSIYDGSFGSMTVYEQYQIGPNRQNPEPGFGWTAPFVVDPTTQYSWTNFLRDALTNTLYSDFDYGSGHGGADRIGGISVDAEINAFQVASWAQAGAGTNANKNWRMRKVAMWSCYSGNLPIDHTYMVWTNAFGIRPTIQQLNSLMYKNVGLFFAGEVPLVGYGSSSATSPEVATALDELWVAGPVFQAGLCDPTYAFGWAISQMIGIYPQVRNAKPVGIGYPYLPYTGIYDENLLMGDYSNVHLH